MILTQDAGEVFFVDPDLQVTPTERRIEGEEREGGTKADLEPPEDSDDETQEHITPSVDADSPKDGLQMLALRIIEQAAVEDRQWFFAPSSEKIFRFWCEVAGLQPAWVIRRAQAMPANLMSACPGLFKHGRCWWIQVYRDGKRERFKLGGPDLDRAAAVKLGLQHRARVMAASA